MQMRARRRFVGVALQGGKTAEVAAMMLVELIVKEVAAEREHRKPKRQMDTWQKRTRAGVWKQCRCSAIAVYLISILVYFIY